MNLSFSLINTLKRMWIIISLGCLLICRIYSSMRNEMKLQVSQRVKPQRALFFGMLTVLSVDNMVCGCVISLIYMQIVSVFVIAQFKVTEFNANVSMQQERGSNESCS